MRSDRAGGSGLPWTPGLPKSMVPEEAAVVVGASARLRPQGA